MPTISARPASGDPSYATRIFLNIFVPFANSSKKPDRALLLPPASQRLIQLNERQTLVELGLDQVEFRREVICFAGQHLEVTCVTVLIKHFGKLMGVLRCLREQFLLLAELTVFLRSDE